jgi:hypothetical protein
VDDDADLVAWAGGLDGLFAQVAGRFLRTEPRRRARAYVRGLLAPLAGKNGWTLAEVAGDATPDGMQRLLNSAQWDTDGVRDDLRGYVVEHLGEPGGVLIVDETGFLKKGLKSAGVQRQYSGTAGRVENCQLGVFCAYATSKGRTLIDRELYLPKSWTSDRDRCRATAVPDEVEFATKAVLAQDMLGRAVDAGVPASWVAADEAYGQDYKFRTWCERRRIGYVVAVPRSQTIPAGAGSSRADHAVAAAPDQAWKRRSCADGAKGPRVFDWAVASVSAGEHTPAGWGRWLLVRRQILTAPQVEAGNEPELAYYLLRPPARHHRRGPHPHRRDAVGDRGARPDREERSRARPVPSPPLRRLVPPRHPRPTRPRLPGSQVRRLLAHLNHLPEQAHTWAWSRWRRRHQHRARTSHYKRRPRIS